ncbi:hypothetical protein HW555_013069 [Spodoptera exigua]|uniref:Uncharacterized protein n=1 Tax=Spodoptera exigua TaxID=7107 RepID=A0A835G281_SPOEX|nr:hypothetical protein HW555_013069 [Spodoptera exigua]
MAGTVPILDLEARAAADHCGVHTNRVTTYIYASKNAPYCIALILPDLFKTIVQVEDDVFRGYAIN